MDADSTIAGQAGAAAADGLAAPRAASREPRDVELMLRYRDGDVHAFELLYARHKGGVYRYLLRMCRSPEAASDLFQETWSKVIASRDRYEVRAQFNTFLYRIAHNCAIDYFRKAGRPQNLAMDLDELQEELQDAPHARPEAMLSEQQLREDFRCALDRLPDEQRDVFVLYEESGLGLQEISAITGVAMETAKSRLRYAVSKLRVALRRHEPCNLSRSVTP